MKSGVQHSAVYSAVVIMRCFVRDIWQKNSLSSQGFHFPFHNYTFSSGSLSLHPLLFLGWLTYMKKEVTWVKRRFGSKFFTYCTTLEIHVISLGFIFLNCKLRICGKLWVSVCELGNQSGYAIKLMSLEKPFPRKNKCNGMKQLRVYYTDQGKKLFQRSAFLFQFYILYLWPHWA